MKYATNKSGIKFKNTPQVLVDYIEDHGLELKNILSKQDDTVAHIQLLSPTLDQLKGDIYYISEKESINSMGEDVVKVAPHGTFDLDDLIGDLIFIKHKTENYGKIWKLRPTVEKVWLNTFPKTLFGKSEPIMSKLTLMQKTIINIRAPKFITEELEINKNPEEFLYSTILVNRDRFVIRENHQYYEIYHSKDVGTYVEREVPGDELIASTPGIIIDIFKDTVTIHMYNPYYFK